MTDPIENRATLGGTPARQLALDALAAGIDAARPERLVTDACTVHDDRLRLTGTDGGTATVALAEFDDLLVVGGGKAAAGVARGLHVLLGDRIDGGRLVVPEPDADRVGPVTVAAGGHPLPTRAGVAATRDAARLLDEADERTLVLAPITGGGSAAFAAPAGVDLPRLRRVTRELLDAGASVAETNAVRRRLSAVKNGRVVTRTAPATVVGLLVSDVVGDPAVIASGPTLPPVAEPDPLAALDRYGIDDAAVRRAVTTTEPPASEHPAFERSRSVVIGDGRTALRAAASAVEPAEVRVVSDRVAGEARTAGRRAAALAEAVTARVCDENRPVVLLTGGETTVTVTGDGRGGPNCEYALAAGEHLARAGLPVSSENARVSRDDSPTSDDDECNDGRRAGERRPVVAAVDTDGADGSTAVAGGLVDHVPPDAARRGLAANDAATTLIRHDAAVRTGATGANLNDLRVIVVS